MASVFRGAVGALKKSFHDTLKSRRSTRRRLSPSKGSGLAPKPIVSEPPRVEVLVKKKETTMALVDDLDNSFTIDDMIDVAVAKNFGPPSKFRKLKKREIAQVLADRGVTVRMARETLGIPDTDEAPTRNDTDVLPKPPANDDPLRELSKTLVWANAYTAITILTEQHGKFFNETTQNRLTSELVMKMKPILDEETMRLTEGGIPQYRVPQLALENLETQLMTWADASVTKTPSDEVTSPSRPRTPQGRVPWYEKRRSDISKN